MDCTEWDNSVPYNPNQIIVDDDIYYACILGDEHNINIDKKPKDSPVYWSEIEVTA